MPKLTVQVRTHDAHIANCRVAFDGQNPVRYIDG
jgi:hypothetical protein